MANVIEPAIAQHSGRIVKSTGDGFFAEFSIAVAALLGREDEARQVVRQLDAFAPGWTVTRMRALTAFKVPEVVDAVCEGLRRAGMPE